MWTDDLWLMWPLDYMHLFSSAFIGIYMKIIERYCLKSKLFVKLKNRPEKPQESMGPQLRDAVLTTLLLFSWPIKTTRTSDEDCSCLIWVKLCYAQFTDQHWETI